MRKTIITLLMLGVIHTSSFSQSEYLDSLYQAYQTEPTSVLKFKNLYKHCFGLMQIDTTLTNELLETGRDEIAASDLLESEKGYLRGLFLEVEANMLENGGNAQKSLEKYHQILKEAEFAEGKNKHLLIAMSYWGKGTHYGRQGFFRKSNQELLKAKDEFILAEQPGKHADVWAQLGQNYSHLGKDDSTIICINQALKLIDPKLDVFNQYYYNFFKANSFNNLGLQDSTIALFPDAYLEQSKKIMPVLYAHMTLSLADAYAVKKNHAKAKELLAKAKIVVDESDEGQLKYNFLMTSLQIEHSAEDYKSAYHALNELKVYEDSLHKFQMDQKYMELQSKFDAQGKDFKIQSLESEAKYQSDLMSAGGGAFMLFLLSGFLWYRNFSQKRKTAEVIAAKEMEVLESKERLFTNITHELRTPLSLIINPLREIESQQQCEKLKYKAGLALDNSQQLLSLVNQVLDWHSLDAKMLKNTPFVGEVGQVVNQSLNRFELAAKHKNITITKFLPEEDIYGKLDFDKFDKILNNLISNALKYSDDDGKIGVKVLLEKKQLQLQIADHGIGIQEKDQKEMFNRFSRSEKTIGADGSGIGLSIVKDLVQLMGGKIKMKSQIGIGTTINLILPFEKIDKPNIVNAPNREMNRIIKDTTGSEKSNIYVVEDNHQLREYITGILEEEYQVESFVSAEEAGKALLENIPDVMILDVMLPGMDGVSFCKKIKTAATTNHIPVLMLTAKPVNTTKMKALEVGVDAWMSKPFEVNELQLQLRNLLSSREILQKKYNRQITVGFSNDKVEIQDDFLQNIIDFISKEISNDSLSVDDLVKVSGLNRSNMSKKIKAMTNQTPVQLIRNIRLEKAKNLLAKNGKNISEIAFEVGFKDPNYFSSCFKDYFGESPRKIKKAIQNH